MFILKVLKNVLVNVLMIIIKHLMVKDVLKHVLLLNNIFKIKYVQIVMEIIYYMDMQILMDQKLVIVIVLLIHTLNIIIKFVIIFLQMKVVILKKIILKYVILLVQY